MRSLITGGTGFVGVHLCEFLVSRGDEVVVFAKDQALRMPSEVRWISGDIRSPAEVQQVFAGFSPEAVYHLAAISSVAAASENPRLALDVNVLGTFNIFDVAARLSSRLRVLNVSTVQVYRAGVESIDEQSPVAPANPYAVSKAMAERVPQLFAASASVDWITVRPFNHSGPGQPDNFVLSSFARQIAEMEVDARPRVLFVGNVEVERDFLDVRDVVRAYRLLIELGRREEIYNVSSGRTYRIADVIDRFSRLSRVPFQVQIDPGRLRSQQPRRIVADSGKLLADTGWKPVLSLETTLQDLLDYWRTLVHQTQRESLIGTKQREPRS